MKKAYLLYLFAVISLIFISSCSEDLGNEEFIANNKSERNDVDDLVEYARIQFHSIKYKNISTNNQPQWSNYKIFKQSKDTLGINIPLYVRPDGEYAMIVARMIDSQKKIFIVKLPGFEAYNLPINIRRRLVITNDAGVKELYRPIVSRQGKLKITRVRDIIQARDGGFNGGTLPEVIVYPGGAGSYEVDWWWWDQFSGLAGGSPPFDYGGYTPPDVNLRPDFFKAENVQKDEGVKAAIKQLIDNLKIDASKDKGRREIGFWVYYDKSTNKYYVGKKKFGDYVKGDDSTHASIKPGSPMPYQNGDHIPKTATPVTFVHTHTPLSYEKDCSRRVGPSPGDIDYANSNNIEIIVIDYVGTKSDDGEYYIHGGHDVNAPTKEYIYPPQNEN